MQCLQASCSFQYYNSLPRNQKPLLTAPGWGQPSTQSPNPRAFLDQDKDPSGCTLHLSHHCRTVRTCRATPWFLPRSRCAEVGPHPNRCIGSPRALRAGSLRTPFWNLLNFFDNKLQSLAEQPCSLWWDLHLLPPIFTGFYLGRQGIPHQPSPAVDALTDPHFTLPFPSSITSSFSLSTEKSRAEPRISPAPRIAIPLEPSTPERLCPARAQTHRLLAKRARLL